MHRLEFISNKTICRPLAQLVEQLAFNQFVEGSNPSRPTTLKALKDFNKIS